MVFCGTWCSVEHGVLWNMVFCGTWCSVEHGVLWNMVFCGTWCSVEHGVLWNMVFCGTWCSVEHGVLWNMVFCGTWCSVEHGVLWNMVFCGTWCSVEHGVLWNMDHVVLWNMVFCGTWNVVFCGAWCSVEYGPCCSMEHGVPGLNSSDCWLELSEVLWNMVFCGTWNMVFQDSTPVILGYRVVRGSVEHGVPHRTQLEWLYGCRLPLRDLCSVGRPHGRYPPPHGRPVFIPSHPPSSLVSWCCLQPQSQSPLHFLLHFIFLIAFVMIRLSFFAHVSCKRLALKVY